MKLKDEHRDLLKRYPKAIFHLRSQLNRSRLVPFFGAGIGVPLGIPNWANLVSRIRSHKTVNGDSLLTISSSQASATQLLFQHYKHSHLEALRIQGDFDPEATPFVDERLTRQNWWRIVHECLYDGAKPYDDHPYLKTYLPVIRKAPLTVNYNFDDAIEHLLSHNRSTDENYESRGYEVIWEPVTQFRSDNSVIYHPNGFLPRTLGRTPSPTLVFAEDSFADQMIDAQRGHYSTLLSHLFRFTGLLIGLSLEDATLKHLLRQSAQAAPGHVHYYVAYRDPAPLTITDEMRATASSNFETYNLVTLFLSGREIGLLAELIAADDVEFSYIVSQASVPKSFTFYLSGAVGVGKTSVLNQLKSLNAIEEWLDERPPNLDKATSELSIEEKATVDSWINDQFKRRNNILSRNDFSISVVDRSPLDPIAFAGDERITRAQELESVFSFQPICDGRVILMKGRPETMHARTAERHKSGSAEYIDGLQRRFVDLWKSRSGVRIVETAHMPLSEVTKKVARAIHMEEYEKISLEETLKSIGEIK